jgi:hypothetical protein
MERKSENRLDLEVRIFDGLATALPTDVMRGRFALPRFAFYDLAQP